MTSTETMTDSAYLSSSLSSLSRSRSTNSLIVRTYKQATQLYLTKRFKEALETLEPIISPQRSAEGTNGHANGEAANGEGPGAAPVAQSSKTTRTKVWVFYLSLLHAIIDLGPEEGKLVFGSTRWRQLAAKAREGTVWDEVVQAGYGGVEGEVDGDVVVNLATLLLGHMAKQDVNQRRLEEWLATSDTAAGGSGHVSFADGTMSPVPNGSSTPKALATRQKILELYALHVLPANEEWEYARQFIEMNDSLDEERREAFLHALQGLREEKDGTAQRERELAEQGEREMAEEQRRRDEEATRKADEARQAEAKRKADEQDKAKAATTTKPEPSSSKPPTAKPTPRQQPSKSPSTRKPPAPPPTTLYNRASSILLNLQHSILHASRSMYSGNANGSRTTFASFRFLLFMFAFLMIVARRDLRLRVRRAVEEGWGKVKRTVGMGVKVSYI